MTDIHSHLTEEERQTLADGSMPAERARELEAHLRACETCAADVDRLERLMRQISDTPAPPGALDELWPSIRSRIEQTKVIPLGTPAASASKRTFTSRHLAAVGGLVAAAAVAAVLLRPSHKIGIDTIGTSPLDTAVAMIAVADSVRSYDEEARTLLNRLELQRSMLRPEAMASIDRDLKVIDQAISELKVAIANDPRNPALRQLLASSYKQKVDLLKRAGNAG